MDTSGRFDVVVIGGGPAGQKAAIQTSKAGFRALVVERGSAIGGECVHRGTIPSKTLRETAAALAGLRMRSTVDFRRPLPANLRVELMLQRQREVCNAHERFIGNQLERNGVDWLHGLARFTDPHTLEVRLPGGSRRTIQANAFVIATGSRPRTPDDIPVDHDHVLDSDSVLSMAYLPTSMVVLGGGVIASEFASIFTALDVAVTIIDKAPRPLAFLEPELSRAFVDDFEQRGGTYLGGRSIARFEVDPLQGVTVTLDDGRVVKAQKALCAVGRVAAVRELHLSAAGIALSARGHIPVNEFFQTSAPHIYAVGDVIGPPALAATAMEQGRRAARHALGLPHPATEPVVPVGIYTIPELATVGMTEAEALAKFGDVVVGRAKFSEVARGWISGDTSGFLKLVAAPDGRIVGAHMAGENVTDYIHVAQMAILGGLGVDALIDNIFNFPTMSESYRVAALSLSGQLEQKRLAA
ncbi:MAG: Si-specific NAD(P)(+) transhydrogenase [Candidatus Eisenbacteria bacterium]|uniref:NAD(P)(+) transhydrogenase (Si-specific) n=1 Tax=Eiseniibacteriota bacterium TaxID=2212470 RepID=A0A849SC88_UNCEI|nr:Si-specific NAD(P)(+) transhydrogenase [Candidatus Eisenbacteria bacterium]